MSKQFLAHNKIVFIKVHSIFRSSFPTFFHRSVELFVKYEKIRGEWRHYERKLYDSMLSSWKKAFLFMAPLWHSDSGFWAKNEEKKTEKNWSFLKFMTRMEKRFSFTNDKIKREKKTPKNSWLNILFAEFCLRGVFIMWRMNTFDLKKEKKKIITKLTFLEASRKIPHGTFPNIRNIAVLVFWHRKAFYSHSK